MGYNVLGQSVTLPTPNAGADSARDASLSRRGELITLPWSQQYVDNERVYVASNATINTALAAGGTAYAATTPAFLLDVAAGTTMVPLQIRLRQGGTVAGGVITVLITADVIARYSSGGTVITPRNMKMGPSVTARRTSAVSVYNGATAAAVNTSISLFGAIITHDVATTPSSPQTIVEWPAANEPLPALVGPASLVIHTFAATTQPSWFFSFKWVELDS